MPSYILVILGLALLATVASVANVWPKAGMLAMGLFALVMVLMLLTVMNDSDKKMP